MVPLQHLLVYNFNLIEVLFRNKTLIIANVGFNCGYNKITFYLSQYNIFLEFIYCSEINE